MIDTAEAVNRGSIQNPDELGELLALLSEDPPEKAVEVGVAFGGTLWALSQVCGKLIGVDRDLSQVDQRNLGLANTHLIEGDSADTGVVAEARAILDGPANFIFIDAAHEPEPMLADFAAWRPVLATGGIMAFHDIEGQAAEGWRELLSRFDANTVQGVTQIVHPTDGDPLGIGLIRAH